MRFVFRGKKRLYAHARLLRCRVPFRVYRDDQTVIINVRQFQGA